MWAGVGSGFFSVFRRCYEIGTLLYTKNSYATLLNDVNSTGFLWVLSNNKKTGLLVHYQDMYSIEVSAKITIFPHKLLFLF